MKITSIETLRTEEFSNVIWVRVHTDTGMIGLGETFYGAGAVEAQIHDTFAGRLLGRNPLHIEAIHRDMLNLPMAQSSTGVEYRAASAIDIALWDLFGKVCNQPVHQMLGGLCRDKQRIYNTCAGTQYVRSTNISPVANWNLGASKSPYEDLDGFMHRADALAENLLESGISAMKIWPFDPAAQENKGLYITAAQMKQAIEPFEKIRKAVGDKMEIMVELHSLWNLPTAKQIARALEPYQADLVRRPDPDELASGAGRICPLHRRLGLRQRNAGLALPLQGHARPRCHACGDGGSVLDRRPHRGPQDRGDGRDLSPALRTARLHRPDRLHRRHPHVVQPAQHADPGIGARLLQGLVQ
ncbi:L-alanine-DL-glutamate epimerase-like enolase superfamily enzyme [Bradyrhizobium sp. LM3.2]